eukprot:10229969-Alexandrium_andersonii.AAC.1
MTTPRARNGVGITRISAGNSLGRLPLVGLVQEWCRYGGQEQRRVDVVIAIARSLLLLARLLRR